MSKKSKNVPALPDLSSTFALIDVKKGRQTLSKVGCHGRLGSFARINTLKTPLEKSGSSGVMP